MQSIHGRSPQAERITNIRHVGNQVSRVFELLDGYLSAPAGVNDFRLFETVEQFNCDPYGFAERRRIALGIGGTPDGSESDTRELPDGSESDAPDLGDVNFANQEADDAPSPEWFWQKIASVRWLDRDEQYMGVRHLQHLDRHSISNMLVYVRRFSDALLRKMNETVGAAAIMHMTPKKKAAFLSHIVAKGQAFYEMCMEDPGVCMYLMETYQDFGGALRAV